MPCVRSAMLCLPAKPRRVNGRQPRESGIAADLWRSRRLKVASFASLPPAFLLNLGSLFPTFVPTVLSKQGSRLRYLPTSSFGQS
jgi:hypothetical protein